METWEKPGKKRSVLTINKIERVNMTSSELKFVFLGSLDKVNIL